jgi:UDP-glucose 6-dehydrogenase
MNLSGTDLRHDKEDKSMKSIQLTDQVYETIRTVALDAGMKDEADFLRQSAYWAVLGKLAKYEVECKCFEGKYNCSFEEFEARLNNTDEAEDFEAEDDYLDWKYAHELYQQWQSRKELLDHA